MVCKQCQELLSEYIDGALELGEQVNIERHLGDCEPCRAVLDACFRFHSASNSLRIIARECFGGTRISSGISE